MSKAEIDRAKSVLRLKARAARRAVLPELRRAAAHAIADRVLALPLMHGASSALLYGASPEEADPSVLEDALRDLGLRIAYPRVAGPQALTTHWVANRESLCEGPFGLLQPPEEAPAAQLEEVSVVVVPGVAFDALGNRLGFGGGYYDALLAEGVKCPPTVGIAYDEQVFDHVPHGSQDRPVDFLVTPTRTFVCATSRP